MIAAMEKKKLSPLAWVLILSGSFFVLFVIITGGVYMSRSKGIAESGRQPGFLAAVAGGAVGVVEVNGAIMDAKKTLKRLEKMEESPEVKAVVLRLNSPGGAVAPSQEIYEAVKAFKKPLVVSMSSVAASGAYYIACGAKKVFANPGTITGSIGVIMEFVNLQKLYEWAKIQRYAIKTGKFKAVGAEYREMTEEERALLQSMVDDVLSQFRKAVAEGRKLPMEKVIELSDGRIYSGSQAKAAKLVDELGTLQDAINAAAQEAKLEGKPRVVYPERRMRSRLLELFLDGGPDDEDASESRLSGDAALAQVARSVLGAPNEGNMPSILPPGVYWLWRGTN